MSAEVQPVVDSGQFATGADKEALAQFWRSGLEYIAQGITAHHNIARTTRICEVYSSREPSDGPPASSLDAQLASHRAILESSVSALAELAASGLGRSPLSHQTQISPSLDIRVAALEDQMKGLLAIVKPLSAKLDTLTGNVTRIESDVKTIEQNSTDNNAHLRNQHKELESHVGGLLAQVNNPRPTQASQYEQINKRLELVEKKLQVAQGELEKQEKRITNTETNITVLEGDRSRQGTKLILLDTKVNGLQSDATDIRTNMRVLLTLAPEAKGLLSVPAQMKRAEQGVEILKEQQEAINTRFNSFESSLGTIERVLEERGKKNISSPNPTNADVSVLHSLKERASSLIELPAVLDQLRISVAELAPLKLYSQDITAVAGKASQLLELISHNERVQDDINQIRSKLARCSKDLVDSKKEMTESTRLLGETVSTLSSTSQAMQKEILGASSQIAQIELSVKTVKEESEIMTARVSGIDAKLIANQVTAQWSQEQIQAMRADIAYLEPLKGQREALLLLSGRVEVLMPLSAKFGSPEFQRILKKAEEANVIMDASRKVATEMVAACRDAQQRLNKVEPHVNQLESDISSALEKLTGLQNASDIMGPQVRATMVSLQRTQNDISPFLPIKSDILSIVEKLASDPSPIDEIQALKKLYAGDTTPMKGEIKRLKASSSALRTELDEAKGKIGPLLPLQKQVQDYQGCIKKLEERLAKLEAPLTIQIPQVDRSGNGHSLPQSLNAGPSGSGSGRWKASTSNSPKPSNTPSRSRARRPVTPLAELQTETEAQVASASTGGRTKLSPLAEDWVALIDKRVETKITSLSQSFTKSEKKLGELEDSVAGIDQLMTVVQGTSNENSISLKLMEKEFANLKADNATKLKEINIKQTRVTIMENEIQRLKDDTSTKLKAIEVTIDELAPLKEYRDPLVALVRPISSPVSSSPHVGDGLPEARLIELEKTSDSATKEIKNLVAWILWAETEIGNYKVLNKEIQALDGHVRELAESIATMDPLATSLTERASDLLGLLERPEGQKISDSIQLTPEQLEGMAQATARMKTLEEQIHALQASQPKLKEDLDQVTSQVGELVPVVNKVVGPFTNHVKPILSLIPLSSHVSSLVPLVDQVPQLHASIQSLSDRIDATAFAAAQNPVDPGPASQLRSPVTDRETSPTEQPTDNTALFIPATSGPRPKKRRRDEERFESLESQLDTVRGELDGVSDYVKMLCTERTKAKRRVNAQPAGAQSGIQSPQSLEPGEVPERRKMEGDLDMLMDTMRSLFEGEGTWPERIDIVLGRQWAQVLQDPLCRTDAGASSTISRILREIGVLKSAIESCGSGTAPPSTINAAQVAWAETLAQKVMADVGKEQAQFRTELEQVISRALLPVKKVFKALKDTSSDL